MIFSAILVGIIILAIVGFIVVTRMMIKVAKRGDTVEDSRVESLYYDIPTGQDPVVLVSAMTDAGYEASADNQDGVIRLVVNTPAGRDRDRAHVRQVIASAAKTSVEGPEFEPGKVLFTDEQRS